MHIKRAVARRVEPAIGLARVLENFDRPPWLYRLGGAVPTGEQCFRAPQPVTSSDLELCERLIRAYRQAQTEAPKASGMWSHSVFQHRQRKLIDALTREEPAVVADLLGSMFRSDFILGMAPGSMVRERRPGPLARMSWLMAMNKLVALAEAVGAVHVENPEQSRAAPALRAGLDDLVDAMEERLGISLDFPQVGAACGVVAAGRLITPESPDLLYAAARLRDVIDAYLPPSDEPLQIVEIGGGYGGMAFWLIRMIDVRYTIVDLPIVGVLQGYFLSQVLGHEAVALYGEYPAQVTITPDHALGTVPTPFDVLANKDSLPEIPLEAAIGYLEWARAAGPGVFYSYNQESAAVFDGTAQNVVCELVERVGGFSRIRRDASWLRRGYVEEVFLPTPAASAAR